MKYHVILLGKAQADLDAAITWIAGTESRILRIRGAR